MGARAAVAVLAVVSVVGWGVAAGLGAALLVAREDGSPVAAVDLGRHGAGDLGLVTEPEEPATPPADTYTLTVHTDGCGVVRSEGPGGVDLGGLTWSVTDADGFQVLGRNALGETHYRYFSPGTYTVVLEAWGGDSYVPVSPAVTITC